MKWSINTSAVVVQTGQRKEQRERERELVRCVMMSVPDKENDVCMNVYMYVTITTAGDEREAEQVDIRKVGEVHAVNGVARQ